jgi:DNA polymerase-4
MCSMQRAILHADLDAFYASVEQRDNPALMGKAVIVGSGVVLAASYEARAKGVRTAMGGHEARGLCPEAIVVEPRMSAYSEASKAVFSIFEDVSPLVEGISIDEAFIDVTGLWRLVGPAPAIAQSLRSRVRDEVGLPISIGVATTKFLAKVASVSAKPDGLWVVPVGGELDYLHPLPVRRLWGVGAITEEKLASRGLLTVGDIASVSPEQLSGWIGNASAHHLHALANNRDPRRVVTGRRRRSVGAQRSLGTRRPIGRIEADKVILELVDRVTDRLRKGQRVGRTVTIRLRFSDFSRATRSKTLPQATGATEPVLRTCRDLVEEVWPEVKERGLTLLGMSISNLDDANAVQLSLPFEPKSRDDADSAVDSIRERFGRQAISPATLLGTRGIEMPMLPDTVPEPSPATR